MIYDEGRATVERLFADAECLVRRQMAENGKLHPFLLLQGCNGKFKFEPRGELSDEKSKCLYEEHARLVCLSQAAEATVFAIEGRIRFCIGNAAARNGRMSKEVVEIPAVALVGETRTGQFQKIVPVMRADDGRLIGLGECPEIRQDRLDGPFSNFLSASIPDDKTRNMAFAVVEMMGIGDDVERILESGRRRGMVR
jgi:hypothetical protein